MFVEKILSKFKVLFIFKVNQTATLIHLYIVPIYQNYKQYISGHITHIHISAKCEIFHVNKIRVYLYNARHKF